ncbi:cAMP-dependent protein kinase regulatory subunit-like isoform X3 [Sceloporus undulatus]|uniref:cAMP-dependent protein kinase regulatory subunit-like isoform X3 n=1 Tax=Sceloporus undulatus TaxID=8520 RepID=UPI001C4D8A39|nr:cAMP-dependent protein kinase regulatory subunit-like isoform X3 [Sceloporus undulatus]
MDVTEQTEAVTAVLSGKQRFFKAASTIAHLCGLVLKGKRYIGRSPVVQWATFYLQGQINVRRDLLFNISDYSKKHFQKKSFGKLKRLLRICPEQRIQQDILQIQACLKTNRAFQCLPSKTQRQLCQVIIYQKYEAGTVIIKQGHVATECYLVLSGKLKFMMANENEKDKISTSETLCEAEGGDFIGEMCLLTNTRRPSSVICKSDAELVVIGKEDFKRILANIRYEQHHAMCQFLRKHLLFSTWPQGKIDFLIQCSLWRFHRAGTAVVTDSLNSCFLIIVHSEASLTPQFLKIRTLEQSDIFGLADIMDKDGTLQLSLISEGATCIFIPKRLFLEAAPAKSRLIALEMLSRYPTKRTIQESYNMQQAWSTYRTKLIGLHLEKHARPGLASIGGW